MNRAIIVFMLIFLCQVPVTAQDISETDSLLVLNSFRLYKDGKYQEALVGYLKVAQKTYQQRTENERQFYVNCQMMTVTCYYYMKQYEKAFSLTEVFLKGNLNDEEKKIVLHQYVKNGYLAAKEYEDPTVGRYADAREIYTKILQYADESMKNRIVPRIFVTWYREGERYEIKLKFGDALAPLEKARNGFHELGLTKNEITTLIRIGEINGYLDDINGAIDAYKQAYQLAASINYDTKQMIILIELRKLSERRGNYEDSFYYDTTIDSLSEATKNDETLFYYYCYKGDEAKFQGKYNLAEKWYKKNESYLDQHDVNIEPSKITYYSKLFHLFSKKKKWDSALKYALLYKETSQHVYKKTDKDYYASYWAIIDVYSEMDDSAHCFQYLDSLFLSTDILDDPRALQDFYIIRASCHSKFNNYKLALTDYKTADSLLATKYVENDVNRIKLLPIMGGLEHKLGHYDESERLYRKYVEAVNILYGDNGSDYINALGYLANAEGFAGHLDDACNDYMLAVNKLKLQINERIPFFTTSEREVYWASVSELMQNMTPFALKAKEFQTAFTKSCYDGLVLTKAFLLESERSIFDLIKYRGTTEDRHIFSMITGMQSKIVELKKDEHLYADSIMEITSDIKRLEFYLIRKYHGSDNLTSFINVDYQKIKDQLNDGDVLIDFTDFVSKSEGNIYAAYIIDNEQEFPLLKKLFAESKIDSMQVRFPDMFYKSPYAENLYQLLWMPLKDHVKEGATVYYVPSQLLFQIALESLPAEDGALLGEHYNFVRLSSARELVNLNDSINFDIATERVGAVLYGGLQYNLDGTVMEDESKKYNISPFLAFRDGEVRGDSIFRYLPYSLKEVETISQILDSCNIDVKTYMGINGTEESFLSLNENAPTILHLSTHGFYYTPNMAKEVFYLHGYSNAMSLSGVVMSGGNAAWSGKELPKGVLGGVLTATEISQLDLKGMELVVLSACHSGRGEATPEGLYGLQRAFKKAGAKTMILSLWKVSDYVGAEFMTLFYKYLSAKCNHWNKRIAFNKAKLSIREKYPNNPFYWAGFVMLD